MKGLTPLNYLDNFVTWEALEQALKGIKDAQPPPPEPVKARTPPPQRIVIEMAMQTDERVIIIFTFRFIKHLVHLLSNTYSINLILIP